jgi:hypothetical protein
MNESDARVVLLLRAFECAPTPLWSETDATWASEAARRAEGKPASFERFVALRATLASARLVKRDARLGALLGAAAPHGWLAWVAILGAFALGAAGNAIGPSGRINILAPPLLALLAWNCAVYLVLLVRALGAPRGDVARGPLRRAVRRIADRAGAWLGAAQPGAVPAVSRFASDWTTLSGALYGARIAVVVHSAAAALAIGALVSLYLRGIAFEFRAGWDSTFLTADNVHTIVAFVLGPATKLSGIELPDVARLVRLRFSVGAGENAAPWIHLYALTTGLVIVLPRTLLAAVALWRARAMTRHFPLPLDDDYFLRLRRTLAGEPLAATVLAYGYRLHENLVGGLQKALERIVGPNLTLRVSAPLPHGAEDDVRAWLGSAPEGLVVVVFPLTATPERETHGAFVHALAAERPSTRIVVIIDESEFRRRFTGAEGARRNAERRGAWERLLRAEELDPVFIDLSEAAAASPASASASPAAATSTGPDARS